MNVKEMNDLVIALKCQVVWRTGVDLKDTDIKVYSEWFRKNGGGVHANINRVRYECSYEPYSETNEIDFFEDGKVISCFTFDRITTCRDSVSAFVKHG